MFVYSCVCTILLLIFVSAPFVKKKRCASQFFIRFFNKTSFIRAFYELISNKLYKKQMLSVTQIGILTTHEEFHLVLLRSRPDTVRGSSLYKTHLRPKAPAFA